MFGEFYSKDMPPLLHMSAIDVSTLRFYSFFKVSAAFYLRIIILRCLVTVSLRLTIVILL